MERKPSQWGARGVGGCLVISGDTSQPRILLRSVSLSTSADYVDRKSLPLHLWSRALGTLLGTKKMRRKGQTEAAKRRRKREKEAVKIRRKRPRRTDVERGQDLLLKNISMRNTETGNVDSAR